MAANEPKGQHFVHRAYLAGFQDPALERQGKPALWAYIPNKKPFPQRPERVAKRNYYYCYEEANARQFRAEHGLAKLEELALPILDKLRAYEFDLSADDRLTFAGYIATAHTRVPTFEQSINRLNALVHAKTVEFIANNPVALKSVVARISAETNETIDAEDFRAKLVGGTVIVEQTNRGWTVRQMFEMVTTLQDVIFQMKWTYLVVGEDDFGFLTSDNPVCLFDPSATPLTGIGFASSRVAHFLFPICRTVCLLAKHLGQDRMVRVDSARVRAVNRAVITRADTQLYAPYPSEGIQKLLDNLVKSRPAPTRVLFKKGRAVEE